MSKTDATDGDQILTLPEVKHLLDKERKDRGELTYEQKLAYEHAEAFNRTTVAKGRKLFKDLQKLERVTPAHAAKIVEIAPRQKDEVEVVFAKDRFTLEPSEIEQILELVRNTLDSE